MARPMVAMPPGVQGTAMPARVGPVQGQQGAPVFRAWPPPVVSNRAPMGSDMDCISCGTSSNIYVDPPVDESSVSLVSKGSDYGGYASNPRNFYNGAGGAEYALNERLAQTWFRVRLCIGLLAVIALLVALVILLLPDGVTSTTSTPSTSQYDCNAGFDKWESGWSNEKKAWCCVKAKRACPSIPEDEYDCHDGVANWKQGWSWPKKAWCCSHKQVACPPTLPPGSTTEAPAIFDCDAALGNAKNAWSEAKKVWCCAHSKKGCPYDCQAGLANWKLGWAPVKKDWCCTHQQKGCAPTPEPYDCDAGFNNWVKGWSGDKKVWCCHNKGKACVAPP